jgi:hypothetical protein
VYACLSSPTRAAYPAYLSLLYFIILIIFNEACRLSRQQYKETKKFCEELIAYFPSYDTGHTENDASNNSSIVAYVFVTTVTHLPSCCLATIRGFLPSRCLATIGGYTYRHRMMGGIFN